MSTTSFCVEEELADLALGAAEELDERRVVVVRDLPALSGEHLLVGHRRAGAQSEVGIAHVASPFSELPRS